jgi:hypothetical protein
LRSSRPARHPSTPNLPRPRSRHCFPRYRPKSRRHPPRRLQPRRRRSSRLPRSSPRNKPPVRRRRSQSTPGKISEACLQNTQNRTRCHPRDHRSIDVGAATHSTHLGPDRPSTHAAETARTRRHAASRPPEADSRLPVPSRCNGAYSDFPRACAEADPCRRGGSACDRRSSVPRPRAGAGGE